MTILAPTETALFLAVRDLLADSYRVSQEDAIGGLFAFATATPISRIRWASRARPGRAKGT